MMGSHQQLLATGQELKMSQFEVPSTRRDSRSRVVSVFRIKSKLRGSKMAMLSSRELAAEHWQPRLSKNSRKCAVVLSATRSTTLIVGSSSSPLSQPPERKSHDPNLPHTQHSTASVAKPSHLQSSSRRAKVCLSPCLRDFPEGFEKCWNAKF